MAHRLVDEVVHGALQLPGHHFEDVPEVVTALKLSQRLSVRIVGHGRLMFYKDIITSVHPGADGISRAEYLRNLRGSRGRTSGEGSAVDELDVVVADAVHVAVLDGLAVDLGAVELDAVGALLIDHPVLPVVEHHARMTA